MRVGYARARAAVCCVGEWNNAWCSEYKAHVYLRLVTFIYLCRISCG